MTRVSTTLITRAICAWDWLTRAGDSTFSLPRSSGIAKTGFNDFGATQAPTRAQRDNFGGTFQYQTAVGRLFLTNGVRVEQNGSFGRAVVPRSSAAYLLRRGSGRLGATKLKFNFGLGIEEPNFTESFSPDPTFLGNLDLRPERTRSFDFGIEQRLLNDRMKVEVN